MSSIIYKGKQDVSGGGETDPYINKLVCLFPFDESTGSIFRSRGVVASSPTGGITTATGSPFLGYALQSDLGKYIKLIGNESVWDFGSADFTIEFWFKLTTLGRFHSLIFRHNNSRNLFPFYAQINNLNKLETAWRYNSTYYYVNGTTALNANQWYFFKGGKEGNTVKVYIDNNLIGQASVTGSMHSLSVSDSNVFLGWYFSDTLSMVGQISNLRITKEVFRDTTIPTLPFSLS